MLESLAVAKPTEITSEHLRRSVSTTMKRVAYSGESFVVTFHGKPVARIVPLDADDKTKKAPAKTK
jgi:prevent-host-death family protein